MLVRGAIVAVLSRVWLVCGVKEVFTSTRRCVAKEEPALDVSVYSPCILEKSGGSVHIRMGWVVGVTCFRSVENAHWPDACTYAFPGMACILSMQVM